MSDKTFFARSEEITKLKKTISSLVHRIKLIEELGTGGGGGGGTGTEYAVTTNFSTLPLASDHPFEIYVVINSQGTPYVGWLVGGDYKPKGLYRSNGTAWDYLGSIPYQATQSEANVESATDKFITPSTLGGWFSQKGIPASKIGNGDITNQDLSYIKDLASNAQDQLDTLLILINRRPDVNNFTTSQLLASNSVNYFNTATGNLTATLPTAVGKEGEFITVIWDSGSNSLNMATTSSQTIAGVTPSTIKFVRLSQAYDFISDGTNWQIR